MDSNDLTRLLFRSGVVLGGGVVFDLLISFIAKLLIARYLGPVSYGQVAIGAAIVSFGGSVLLIGLDLGVGRYLPRLEGVVERQVVMATPLVITLPLAVGAGLLLTVGRRFVATKLLHAPEMGPLLPIFAVGLPFVVVFQWGIGVVQGHKLSMPKALLKNITLPLTRFAVIAGGIAIGATTFGLSVSYVFPYVIGTVALLYWLQRTEFGFVPLSKIREHEPLAWDLIRFSAPLVITQVMLSVLVSIDRFILSYFQPTEAVGVYSVVYPLASVLTSALGIFAFIAVPVFSELDAESDYDELQRLYQLVTKWIVFATVPVVVLFVFFPAETIQYTFGPAYQSGALALVILSLGFFVNISIGPSRATLLSIGRTQTLAGINFSVACLNVLLNILFIPEWSVIGAAVATAVAYAGMGALYVTILYVTTGVQPWTSKMGVPVIFGTGWGALLAASYTWIVKPTWQWAVSHAVLFVLGYAVSLLAFGVESDEVLIVESAEERFDVSLGPLTRILRFAARTDQKKVP